MRRPLMTSLEAIHLLRSDPTLLINLLQSSFCPSTYPSPCLSFFLSFICSLLSLHSHSLVLSLLIVTFPFWLTFVYSFSYPFLSFSYIHLFIFSPLLFINSFILILSISLSSRAVMHSLSFSLSLFDNFYHSFILSLSTPFLLLRTEP